MALSELKTLVFYGDRGFSFIPVHSSVLPPMVTRQ